MAQDFLIIAITRPDFFEGEEERIKEILENEEADLLHIRKPDASSDQIAALLNKIDKKLYPRIKLHDHFELLEIYPLRGIHLNKRNAEAIKNVKNISKSIHSLDEIKGTEGLEYFFLSPVFDSISKQGYKAAFNLDTIPLIIKGKKAVALGGVTPSKFSLLKSLNFSGAALLSYFFPKA